MVDGSDKEKNAINIYLAEFNSLRSEVMIRIQTQNQAFNFLLISIGASITAVVTSANSAQQDFLPLIIMAVLLALPVITCPLGLIFFDNEIMIHAAGSFIHYQRARNIPRFTGSTDALKYPIDFENLPPFTAKLFPWVSPGRWILFCVPTFPSLALVPVYLWGHIEEFSPYLQGVFSPYLIVCSLLYIVDFVICMALGSAMSWIFVNKRFQDAKRVETYLYLPVSFGGMRPQPTEASGNKDSQKKEKRLEKLVRLWRLSSFPVRRKAQGCEVVTGTHIGKEHDDSEK